MTNEHGSFGIEFPSRRIRLLWGKNWAMPLGINFDSLKRMGRIPPLDSFK